MAKLKRVFCVNCKKPIFRSTGRFNEAVKFGWKTYCSRKCEYQHKRKRRKLTCENCGKLFERTLHAISPHNYCSQSCASTVNNKRSPKRTPEFRICPKCRKRFKRGTGNLKYCSFGCRFETNPNHVRQKLINIIKAGAQKLKRTPARREIKENKTCQKFFGSWNNAVIAAGFKPNRSHSQRMYKRTTTQALDGHLCDSASEAIIDNWFIKNNIPHQRDVCYPNTLHRADWEIMFQNQKIFVEYFGLANDSPRYDRSIQKKKALCQKHNIKLVGIYPRDLYPKINLDSKLKMLID